MDADERIERLVDDATAGLKDDAELRLDVRAELASHIDEAVAAHEAGGSSPEEALELAMKGFGPVAEVAEGLVAANRRRMKLRALARLAARALLVPAAVVVALVVCSRLVPLRGAIGVFSRLTDEGQWSAIEQLLWSCGGDLPEQQGFLFSGDESRPTRSAQQRAIWEARPESRAWFGHYVSYLVGDYQDGKGPVSLDDVERELRRGEQLDPDNGRYGLLRAALWAQKAAELKKVSAPRGGDTAKATQEELVVLDRALLDRAMAELRRAAGKPYLRTYHVDVLREQMAALSPVRRFEERLGRIAWAAGTLLPDCTLQRTVARIASRYGEILIAEGRREEGEAFLDLWQPLAMKCNEDAFTLVELLVTRAVVAIWSERSAAAYERLGDGDKAAATRRRAEHLTEPFEGYMTRRKRAGADPFHEKLARSGSVLDQALFPALDPAVLAEVDLGPGRRLEHVLVEEAAVSGYLVVLVVLMALSVAAALRWRWAGGMKVAPLLLLPGWRTLGLILGVGILVPLAVFYAYTRWSGLAGREYGFSYLGPRFALELMLLGATVLLLTRGMAARAIRRRCESLGIAVPPRPWWPKAAWVLVVGLWAWCLSGSRSVTLPAFGVVMGVLLLGGLVLAVHYVFGRREHGLYSGTVARSLIPVFAAAAIAIGVLAHPLLRASEVRLLRVDSSLSASSGPLSFTRAEALLVERLKAQVTQAARDLDSDT